MEKGNKEGKALVVGYLVDLEAPGYIVSKEFMTDEEWKKVLSRKLEAIELSEMKPICIRSQRPLDKLMG